MTVMGNIFSGMNIFPRQFESINTMVLKKKKEFKHVHVMFIVSVANDRQMIDSASSQLRGLVPLFSL